MTTNPVTAETAVETGPGGGRRSKAALGFAIGFPVAAAMTALAMLFAISGGGLTDEPASPMLFWLLAGSLAIALLLAGFVVHRVMRITRWQREATPGGRLHLRFVALFSAAALAPALVVALFMGAALSQGLENWFNARVVAVIERGGDLGRYMVNQMREPLVEDVRLMASDLNRAVAGLREDPQTYGRFLAQQAEGRFMSAAYVIDSGGNILARAESDQAPAFQQPTIDVYSDANNGAVAERFFEGAAVFRVLTRLDAYQDAYLYVVRPLDAELLRNLRAFDDDVDAY
jgi:two-component system nitrogen regulation sensor histidine kinase NtrY